MDRKHLLPMFIVVCVDLLGFSFILPLLPYYANEFGATPAIVGLLVASYAAAQFIGAPILGRLSDVHGRRPILLLSVAGTFIGFLLLALAPVIGKGIAAALGAVALANLIVLGLLFASRLLDGFTGGNLTIAQAYIADVTDEKNRAKSFGLIGAAFGLGFIIGPALGGVLSNWGYEVPAYAAAALSLVNLCLIYFLLPESWTPEKRAAATSAGHKRPAMSWNTMLQALQKPRVGPLLHIRFFFGLAFAMFQTIFALYAQYRLNLTAQSTAYILTYVGVLSVIVQGFGVGWVSARVPEKRLIFAATILMAISLFAWAVVPTLFLLLIVMIPLAVSGGILNTVLNSALSKSVYPEEIGGTLGISSALESLTRVFSPIIGGLLLQALGTWAPGIFSAIVMTWVAWFAWRRLIQRPDPPLPARGSAAPESFALAE
jgi:DHA1 family tetracycline resistance protein-like MFS transporter